MRRMLSTGLHVLDMDRLAPDVAKNQASQHRRGTMKVLAHDDFPILNELVLVHVLERPCSMISPVTVTF